MSRLDKINHQLQREISLIIQRELSDPRLQFVSIMSVDTSTDLRTSKVYFSVFGDASQVGHAAEALGGAGGMIRKLIGQRMSMRYTPKFTFHYDRSIEAGDRMDRIFQEIHDKDKVNQPDNREE